MSMQICEGSRNLADTKVAEQPQNMQEESTPAPAEHSTGFESKARVVLTYTGLSRCLCPRYSSHKAHNSNVIETST